MVVGLLVTQEMALFQTFNVSPSTMDFERNLPLKLIWDATCVGRSMVLTGKSSTVIGIVFFYVAVIAISLLFSIWPAASPCLIRVPATDPSVARQKGDLEQIFGQTMISPLS